jgi:hypothetical protein
MEVAYFFEAVAHKYRTTRHYNLEKHNEKSLWLGNLRICILKK